MYVYRDGPFLSCLFSDIYIFRLNPRPKTLSQLKGAANDNVKEELSWPKSVEVGRHMSFEMYDVFGC